MDTFLTEVLASASVGMLSWLGGYFLTRLKTQHPVAGAPGGQIPPYGVPAGAPLVYSPAQAVNIGQVLIHTGILQFVVNVVGFAVGFLVAAVGVSAGVSVESRQTIGLLIILVLGTLIAIVAFCIIGMLVDKAVRWQHLTLVALETMLLTLLINSLAEQLPVTFAGIIFAAVQTFLALGIGGGLAMLIRPNGHTRQPAPNPPQLYAYAAVPSYPPTAVPAQNIPQYPAPGAPWAPAGPAQPGYGPQGQPPMYPPPPPSSV
jgi:hypothetical protein